MIVLEMSEIKKMINDMEKTEGKDDLMLSYEIAFENGETLKIIRDDIFKYKNR